jgi:uncharacterized protein YlxP (DUF503 family)
MEGRLSFLCSGLQPTASSLRMIDPLDQRRYAPGQDNGQENSMLVGVLTATMYMQGINSLKDKRHVVKSVIGRLQSRFNVSVSEVEHQDSKTCAVLGMAVVSNERVFVEQQLDAILNFMRNDGRFYLGQVEREIFS